MRCDKDTYFYQSYRDEIVLAQRQAKEVKQPGQPLPSLADLGPQRAREIFSEIGVIDSQMQDGDYEEVLRLARERKNPYA